MTHSGTRLIWRTTLILLHSMELAMVMQLTTARTNKSALLNTACLMFSVKWFWTDRWFPGNYSQTTVFLYLQWSITSQTSLLAAICCNRWKSNQGWSSTKWSHCLVGGEEWNCIKRVCCITSILSDFSNKLQRLKWSWGSLLYTISKAVSKLLPINI